MNSETKLVRRVVVGGSFSSNNTKTVEDYEVKNDFGRWKLQSARSHGCNHKQNGRHKNRVQARSQHDRETFLFVSLLVSVVAGLVAIACSSRLTGSLETMPLNAKLIVQEPSPNTSSHTTLFSSANEMTINQKSFFGLSMLPASDEFLDRRINDAVPDYGGLRLTFTKYDDVTSFRGTYYEDSPEMSAKTDHLDHDNYYAYDDDYIRNPYIDYVDGNNPYYEDENWDSESFRCRRISEHRLYFPNCNIFHETPLLEAQATVIGEGAYRLAMKLENFFGEEKETVVVKDIHFWQNYFHDVYEYTRMDSIVAERLTASNRIYNIYGTCGVGILSEFFGNGHIETIAIDEYVVINRTEEMKSPLTCYNDLSGFTKLQMSLHMAEALADLHGYSGGVIVHQDVKLDQFFINDAMTGLKLNDFNRAEFMLWDAYEKEYCMYTEGYGAGNWRSPEEYHDQFLNEKVDVFSLGNNMYGLLTGIMVFQEARTYEEVQERVAAGEKAFIDPRYKERSLEESKLADIIEKCHEYNPDDRPSIFEVVELLREALDDITDIMSKSEYTDHPI